MKRSLSHNLSVNTFQLIVNQLSGLVIFYILSTHLDKNNFGQISLVLAILLAAFNILSLGIDQLAVKKVAAGDDARATLGLYCLHVLLTGFLFYGLLLLGYCLFPTILTPYKILLLIGAGKLMIYFSTPFKQVANGLERFRLIAVVSVVSNVVRGIGLLLFAWWHQVNLQTVIIIFISGDVMEFILSGLIFSYQTRIMPALKWDGPGYLNLIKSALPQAGVVIITSALARFDWIFIGLMVSVARLAEYSFAYKIYELSAAPLLALAPLLIPRFTKMFKDNNFSLDEAGFLIRLEMVVAALTILVLNICWSPVIDGLTAGKYGMVNQRTIFILSLSTPLVYLNNFLWTMYFAQGRLKMILKSFILAVGINIVLDIILIPVFKNEGAAIAILLSLIGQCIFYIKQNDFPGLNKSFYSIIICTACAVAAAVIARQFFTATIAVLLMALLLFGLLLAITRQVSLKDYAKLSSFLKG